jgi:hypothetical protein
MDQGPTSSRQIRCGSLQSKCGQLARMSALDQGGQSRILARGSLSAFDQTRILSATTLTWINDAQRLFIQRVNSLQIVRGF